MVSRGMVLHDDDHEKRHNTSNDLAGEFVQIPTLILRMAKEVTEVPGAQAV